MKSKGVSGQDKPGSGDVRLKNVSGISLKKILKIKFLIFSKMNQFPKITHYRTIGLKNVHTRLRKASHMM